MAISKAPGTAKPEEAKKTASERKIQEFINQGGSSTAKGRLNPESADATKSIKLILKETEMEAIKQLRNQRPRNRNKKITISIHDWVLEAIEEKILREQKKYGLTLL
ncbi:hypothetical protein GCM10027299_49610 [Larkinella ripae]